MPINRPFSSVAIKNVDSYRMSAVGIHIFPKNNSFYCILIQRPSYQGVHSAQVSFPGGKAEQSDPTIEYTARRESWEEVGIQMNDAELLGKITAVYIPVSNFLVEPFVYYLQKEPTFKLDDREVDSLILFDLKDLMSPHCIERGTVNLGNGFKKKDIPYFNIENKVIWGATAMMLSELRDILGELDPF